MHRSIVALTALSLAVTLVDGGAPQENLSEPSVATTSALHVGATAAPIQSAGQPVATEQALDPVIVPDGYSSQGPATAEAVEQEQADILPADGGLLDATDSDPTAQSGGVAEQSQSGSAVTGDEDESGQPNGGGELLSLAQADVTSDVAIVGVVFQGSAPTAQVDFLYRVRHGDVWTAWTDWEPLDPDEAHAEGGVPGSEPITVTGANQVEVAAKSADAGRLPVATLTVIDPNGTSWEGTGAKATASHGADAAVRTASLQNVKTATGLSSDGRIYDTGFDGLKISTRAGWDADESLRYPQEDIIKVRGAVIHHTAGTNDYTQAQVPSILRGIYYYHAVTLDWGDVGYNFLVDKFGGVWEGRKNSLTRSVKGAHAYGANSDTFGISVLGDYSTTALSAAAQEAVAKTIAWKLGQVGVTSIDGTIATRQNITIPIVSGHRDVGSTTCPGQAFYDRLPAIRARIRTLRAQAPTPVPDTPSWHALWEPRRQIGNGWKAGEMFAAGAFSAPGATDAALIDAAGDLWLYPGSDSTRFADRKLVGWGWGTMDQINMGSDFDGDGVADVVARIRATGDLMLYQGDGSSGFKASRRIGWGWGAFSRITVLPGSGGETPSVLAVDGSSGQLRSYPTNGRGTFMDVRPMGYGWQSMTELLPAGDRTGDGRNDVLAVDGVGAMWLYEGTGDGRIGSRRQVGQGWGGFRPVRAADPGSGVVWTVDAAGLLWRYRLTGV